ncbi:hypothetical protein [uncultured Treponema sp.]|uniref:hypothetical protein n=1 Tax=uncultured Treponema sp. TaxID=162155 RepID=UPI0025E25148|nr:hypothetical protein [uncultured Treponema sp.]
MKKRILFLALFAVSFNLFALQKIHFSVDDVIGCFENLTRNENRYDSAFDEPFLAYIKSLHEKYNARVSLYCFYEKEGFSLADCTEKFADEFKESSGWLKFGFHAEKSAKGNTFDGGGYGMFVSQIERITGAFDCITRTVRLDYFSGDKRFVESISDGNTECGIRQLLCADSSSRDSYYLDSVQKRELNKNEMLFADNLAFVKTDFRFDDIKNFKKLFSENKDESEVVVFTHEWLLEPARRRNALRYFLQLLNSRKIKCNIDKFFKYYKDKNCEYVFEF